MSTAVKLDNAVPKMSAFPVDTGFGDGQGIWDCQVPPPGAYIVAQVFEVRLSEIRSRNLFSHRSSELRGHS